MGEMGGWDIDLIDVKIPYGDLDILAYINTNIPSSKEQRLCFTTQEKPTDPNSVLWSVLTKKTVDRVPLTPALAKTMKLSATITQAYENESRMTMMLDGTLQAEQRARGDYLPIKIPSFPEFKPGKCYRIKVVNTGEDLKATFVEVDAKTSNDNEHEIKQPLAKISTTMNTMFPTLFGDPELDSLDISELKRRYTAAKKELSTAHQKGEESGLKIIQGIETSLESDISVVHEEMEASNKVKRLAGALERKGVPTFFH